MNSSGIPPDICIASSDKENEYPTTDYGALVSSIKLKSKGSPSDDALANIDELLANSTSSVSSKSRESPSSALNVSLDNSSPGVVRSFYHKFKRGQGNVSPLESSNSSLSESESRTSTLFGGKNLPSMHFSTDSSRDCDHRLKLYFETRMFNGAKREEFRCMIKVYIFDDLIPSGILI